jgi:hypothetical protein
MSAKNNFKNTCSTVCIELLCLLWSFHGDEYGISSLVSLLRIYWLFGIKSLPPSSASTHKQTQRAESSAWPWRWKQKILPKRRHTYTRLHGITHSKRWYSSLYLCFTQRQTNAVHKQLYLCVKWLNGWGTMALCYKTDDRRFQTRWSEWILFQFT